MNKTTLEIFDFDWTLFRSPSPPDLISAKKTFIHSSASLEPPYVPWKPGNEFWIESVVQRFRDSQSRRDSLTALVTARRDKAKLRILELISQKNLDPNFSIFRSSSFRKDKDKVYFKRRAVLGILDKYPTIFKIVLWEDEQEQIDGIKDVASRRKIKFESHLINEKTKGRKEWQELTK